MAKVRYGVVGAGWISQIAFMPAVAQTENSEMTALVSGNPVNAQKLADFHKVPNVVDYDGYDAMLADDLVDAVYIALPNSMHADFTIRAARAGKHVLVEKPLAITVDECEAMIAAADDAGVLLMTAYRLHCDPGTVEMLEQIRAGAIGTPRYFSSIFSFQTNADNHRLRAEHWGGPLQDIGVYCLNAARHVFGAEPIEVTAMRGYGDGDPRFAEVEETIAVTLRFPGERFGQFIVSFGSDAVDMFHVAGTAGVITMDPAYAFQTETDLTVRKDEAVVLRKTAPVVDHFGAQTAYFSDCILNGWRPKPDGQEGLADVRALRAIDRAAETGLPQQVGSPQQTSAPGPDTARVVPRTDYRLVL